MLVKVAEALEQDTYKEHINHIRLNKDKSRYALHILQQIMNMAQLIRL
jgi:hypothetical protein